MNRSPGMDGFQPNRMRELRNEAGLSCDELAVLAGVNPKTVRAAESGARRPGARVVTALAQALGTTTDELAPLAGPETLKALRQAHGQTQRDVAESIGVSVQMVSRVENGVYSVRQPAVWAAAYRVSPKRWQAAWEAGREDRRRRIRDRQSGRGGIE